MRKIFLLLAMSLCGCEDPWQWAPSGNQAEPFGKASYECERDTRMSAASFGTGVLRDYYAKEFATRCMAQKGWYKQKV